MSLFKRITGLKSDNLPTVADLNLESIVEAATRMASGDLTASASPAATDRALIALSKVQASMARIIGELAANAKELTDTMKDLNELSASMRGSAVSMHKKAESIDSAAQGVNTTMASISAAAEKLNSAMAQTSRRSAEISNGISAAASASGQMTATISEIAGSAEKCRSVAEGAASMIQATSNKIADLGKAAASINSVVSIVNEISEQTKLLALNATIEAARAGEAGRGFAVVANEVKELAKQTGEATAEIKRCVANIQSSAQNTMEEINQIHNVFDQVNGSVKGIAAAVEQQSVATKDIAQAVGGAAAGAAEIDNALHESAAALSDIAGNLARSTRLVSEIIDNISSLARDGGHIVSGSTKAYAGAVGAQAMAEDMATSLDDIKLPPSTTAKSAGARRLIRFTDQYSLGIQHIDSDHRRIMDFINDVYSAVLDDAPLASINKSIGEMAQFVVGHFANEEKLFDKYAYPETVHHKEIHHNLLAKVSAIAGELQAGHDIDLIAVLKFLRDWLKVHILGEDKRYAPFLKDAGVR